MIHFLSSNTKKRSSKRPCCPICRLFSFSTIWTNGYGCADTDSRLHSRPGLQCCSLFSLGYSPECELIWNPDVSEKQMWSLKAVFKLGHCSVDDVTWERPLKDLHYCRSTTLGNYLPLNKQQELVTYPHTYLQICTVAVALKGS